MQNFLAQIKLLNEHDRKLRAEQLEELKLLYKDQLGLGKQSREGRHMAEAAQWVLAILTALVAVGAVYLISDRTAGGKA